MRLTLKLFASLTRCVPGVRAGIPFHVDASDGATVGELVKELGLPAEEVKVVFVNGRARPEEWQLQEGDEVGVFPPIGGG